MQEMTKAYTVAPDHKVQDLEDQLKRANERTDRYETLFRQADLAHEHLALEMEGLKKKHQAEQAVIEAAKAWFAHPLEYCTTIAAQLADAVEKLEALEVEERKK